LPANLRQLYEQGVAEGVFRGDVDFDVLYATAVVTLMMTPGMAGRFPSLTADRGMDGLREQLLTLLMDGLTGGRT